MLNTVLHFIERHELQWFLYFLLGVVTLVRVPEILTEDEVDRLRGSCGMYNYHVCMNEGCFFEPAIVSVGQPRAKLLGDLTPTHLEILYKVSYFRSASRIIKTKTSIDCLQSYERPTMSNIYIALIPAIITALFIIGLLIFLKPSSEVYYLVDNKDEKDAIDFTIDDDSDEEICNTRKTDDVDQSQSIEQDDEEIYRTNGKPVSYSSDIENDPFSCDKKCDECDVQRTVSNKTFKPSGTRNETRVQRPVTDLSEDTISKSTVQHSNPTVCFSSDAVLKETSFTSESNSKKESNSKEGTLLEAESNSKTDTLSKDTDTTKTESNSKEGKLLKPESNSNDSSMTKEESNSKEGTLLKPESNAKEGTLSKKQRKKLQKQTKGDTTV